MGGSARVLSIDDYFTVEVDDEQVLPKGKRVIFDLCPASIRTFSNYLIHFDLTGNVSADVICLRLVNGRTIFALHFEVVQENNKRWPLQYGYCRLREHKITFRR